ncbi:MAG: pantoate--beta-alanine ligase [Bacteroidales bacterium]|jgi:pantoate--beta-alanine ligase|nr:pantoate--beta-alanine ligase [Bacteroidales bacterium]MBR4177673.1 pantoate--beta-alanine ligase [Bacteroidales bacterium]
MQKFTTVAALREAVHKAKADGKSIGLVPTMGALHEGHLSLIRKAKEQNDIAVVSVFVNPIQFNNKEDLAKYPRTVDADCEKLESVGADFVFIPSVEEMYPEPVKEEYHFGPLEEVMEGPKRPGHFSGVAVVVRRLFDLAEPDRAYFGEKDYQQLAIIRNLIEQIHYNIEIVPCPIVRADDGLALSSRNMRLSPAARAIAPTIYDTLQQAAEMAECEEVDDVKEWVMSSLASFNEVNPDQCPDGLCFEPEYFEIVDARTLQPIETWDEAGEDGAVGCIAVWLDGVRLIDIVKF